MSENVVQRAGRVEYIEPNSLFAMSEDNKVQNGIPQPYEDYSFSVNLRVINGNRYDCGHDGNDGRDVLEYSSDHGTLSFMDGTVNNGQSYLTTNFTDISMNDPSTNTKECLGIEHISIRYDSWYYPTVDIKFVDVRGASLMQPSEYEYYNNGGPNVGKPGKGVPTSHSDFFRAFFSFPYPLFKLSVKGFYGKEVTYDLSVLKCNIELNSSTGNFEMNASFIGYMYGMYADMPFPFIYLAPYINLYGRNTWDEKKSTGDFCYISPGNDSLTGRKANPVIRSQMYTFPELRDRVRNASSTAKKKQEDSEDGVRSACLEKLIKKLENEVFHRYPTLKGKYKWWSWSKEGAKDGFYFLSLDGTDEMKKDIFNDFLNFCRGFYEYDELVAEMKKQVADKKTDFKNDPAIMEKDVFESFYKSAKEIKNDPQKETKLVSAEYTTEDIKKILSDNFVTLVFKKNGEGDQSTLSFNRAESSLNGRTDYDDLINELLRRFKENDSSPMSKISANKEWTIIAFKIKDIDYHYRISDTLTNMKKENEEILKKLDKDRDQMISDLVGFSPYIKNAFNMIFAHVDTFMSIFYNVLDRIRKSIQSSDDESRKKDKVLGKESSPIQVDVNDATLAGNVSNGGKLPPFTMFYQEQEKKDSKDREVVMLWPGNIEGAKDFDEVKLVEEIINATSLSKRKIDPVTAEDNVVKKEGMLAPISYYDIITEDWNPYLDILNEKTMENPETPKRLVEVFMLRCFYALLSGGADILSDRAKTVAEIEVENVNRALQKIKMRPTKSFIEGLNMLPLNGSDFIADYFGVGAKIFSTNGSNGNVSYEWIKKKDSYALPVGMFGSGELLKYRKEEETLGGNYGKFVKIGLNGSLDVNGYYACRIYSGGKKIENTLEKYTSGDFVKAKKLFQNYNTLPETLKGIGFANGTFSYETPREEVGLAELYNNIGKELSLSAFPDVPSVRKTAAGTTSVFMDPLYYAQKTPEARAYMFLMGVQYENGDNFILPKTLENGDYPTLLLLREGAIYWRNSNIIVSTTDDSPIYSYDTDPITYEYAVNGVKKDVYEETEKYDPRFGRRQVLEVYKNMPIGSSLGRKEILIDYFVKWADGIDSEFNPDAAIPSVTGKTSVTVDIPNAVLSFPEIEKYLALWETYGTVNRILSPENCYKASSAKTINEFGNSELLRAVYEVGKDGSLGKAGDKARTGVMIKSATGSDTPDEVLIFLTSFKRLYVGFDSFIDFSRFGSKGNITTVPRNMMNDAISAFIKGLKKANKVSVEDIKDSDGVDSSGQQKDVRVPFRQFKSDDFKLACYIALKNMYDRWLCNSRRENWIFSCKDSGSLRAELKKAARSDFERFYYINEFYQDIGLTIPVNLTNFSETMCNFGGFTEKTNETNLAANSLMKALSTTAQYAGCAMLTLPTKLGLSTTYSDKENTIIDVFKAFPYNEATKTDSIETSFVVLYSNQKSSFLDNKDDKGKMAYKTDGFDIANTWGKIVPQPMFSDNTDGGYVVPCFGVTFAKQNQSYFKDIRLSMEDHQVTEYSIKNELMISYQSNKGPRESVILGQDLYSVFSNYSYSCTVSMLGDSQITPLMYFQLNNIPMWKGAYMITNVRHDISVNGMETQFTGVRQARPSLPTKEEKTTNPADDAAKMTPESQEVLTPADPNEEDLNISKRPLDLINVEDVRSAIITLDRTSLRTGNRWVNGFLSVDVYYNDGTSKNFRDMAETIEATFGLVENMGTPNGRIENFTPPQDNSVVFCIPAGKYSSVITEKALIGEEYRGDNDTFYEFTEGKHMTVNDMRLGYRRCEIITGETDYDRFEEGGFKEISLGGTAPIMIYSQKDKSEIRATYRELFDFVNRMNNARKPVSFLLNEEKDIKEKKMG